MDAAIEATLGRRGEFFDVDAFLRLVSRYRDHFAARGAHTFDLDGRRRATGKDPRGDAAAARGGAEPRATRQGPIRDSIAYGCWVSLLAAAAAFGAGVLLVLRTHLDRSLP
jgi:hypothetical protein